MGNETKEAANRRTSVSGNAVGEALAGNPVGEAMEVRTDPGLTLRFLNSKTIELPKALEALIADGFEIHRHCKLKQGQAIRGTFLAMEDGELASRMDRTTGEVTTPQVKWVYLQLADGVSVRLLGAYNMVSALVRVAVGQEVIIARGADYELPSGFRCTDYYVMPKRMTVGAAKSVVDVTPSK